MKYRVIKKEELANSVKKIVVQAPQVALNAKPGQFVMVMVDSQGERIPLTIAESDKTKGLITLIFQEVGFPTKKLG